MSAGSHLFIAIF